MYPGPSLPDPAGNNGGRETIIASWSGKAVSENDRLLPGRGRWRANPAYKAFKESVAWVLRIEQENMPPIKGPVCVRLFLELNPKMDAQNVIKPVLDAIQLSCAIVNDKQIRTFSFYREDREARGEDRIGIIVQEIS